jgi:hypothetical protein
LYAFAAAVVDGKPPLGGNHTVNLRLEIRNPGKGTR